MKPSKLTLEQMMRHASQMAEEMFDEHGEVPMFWLAEPADGERMTIITPVEGPPGVAVEVKNEIVAKVRGLFRKHDVRRYAQVCEGWQSSKDNCRPSEDPDRREVVVVVAADEHEYLEALRDIVRPPNGKPYLAKLSDIERPKEIKSGRFSDVLWRPGRLRRSNELDDDEGRVFVTDVPGASIIVMGRRDPATGDLCVSGTCPVNEETKKGFANLPSGVEIVSGPEAKQLVAAVSKLKSKDAA
jgi:hypothetical protein